MTDNSNKPDPDTTLPGVPLPEFEAAIKALRRLRDDGKYTIMLTRTGAVRMVGAADDFQQALFQESNQETVLQSTGKMLTEIRNFCQLRAFFTNPDRALSFLRDNIYDDTFEKLTPPDASVFQAQLAQKLELASSLLPTAYKQRQRRLETATTACLEDLDAELVRKRHDDYQGLTIDQPFLRLRFRHSGASDELPCFLSGPWGSSNKPSRSFELECDEVDIDVLMFRLAEAKKMLLSAVEGSEPGTKPSE